MYHIEQQRSSTNNYNNGGSFEYCSQNSYKNDTTCQQRHLPYWQLAAAKLSGDADWTPGRSWYWQKEEQGGVNDGSVTGEHFCTDDDHIKRPMNGFMVFAQSRRKQLATLNPFMHNTEISKILGKEWKEMIQSDRQVYMAQALRLQKLHSLNHPNYKYKPKRRKPEKLKGNADACAKRQKSHFVKGFCQRPTPLNCGVDFKRISTRKHLDDSSDQSITNEGCPNSSAQWWTCLRDVFDVDKEEFSQYLPKTLS